MRSVSRRVNTLIVYFTILEQVDVLVLDKLYSKNINKTNNLFSIRYQLDLNYGTQ